MISKQPISEGRNEFCLVIRKPEMIWSKMGDDSCRTIIFLYQFLIHNSLSLKRITRLKGDMITLDISTSVAVTINARPLSMKDGGNFNIC